LFIHRPRIEALFERAKNGGHILVSAPAGFGKTVTTAYWVRESGREAAWLTVDMYDNDPNVFYDLLCNAIISVQPDNDAMNAVFLDPHFKTAPVEFTIRMLAEFRDTGKNYALILDDLHGITNKRILHSLSHLFRRLPKSFLTILLSRDARGEWYGRLAKEGAAIVSAEDLCFTGEELRAFFRSADVQLSEMAIEDIQLTTGGWPIGVIALAMMHGPEIPASGASLMQRYFTTQLWPHVDGMMKQFILTSAVTDEMSGELSGYLTGDDDAEEKLAELYAGNFFMSMRLDGTYSFHRIILDLIRETAEYKAQDFRKLYTAVSDYYVSRKQFFKASHYAYLSRDIRTVIANGFPSVFAHLNSYEEVRNYSESSFKLLVPEDLCEKAPFMYITNAFIAYLGAHADTFLHFMDKMYANWETIAGQYPEMALSYYLMALQDHRVPYGETCEWGAKHLFVERFNGVKFVEGSTLTHNFPFLHRGTRDFSEFTDKKLLRRCTRIHAAMDKSPNTSEVFNRIIEAGLFLERNRLDEALDAAMLSVSETSADTMHEIRFAALMTLAAVHEAMDNFGEYAHVMQVTEKYINESYIFLRPNFLAVQTRTRLWKGDQGAARGWLENYFVHSTRQMKIYEIPLYFTTLRALIALGRLEDARLFVPRFRKLVKDFERNLDRAELDVLDSIVKWNRGQQDEAVNLLADVLQRLQPYGYSMPVGAEGAAVMPILKRLLMGKKGAQLDLERKYILNVQVHAATRAQKHKGIAAHISSKPRMLSRQQKMILNMLAEGRSNKEISQITGLTIHTVKWHSKEAYAKLKVNNVANAIVRARELGYLP